MSAMRPIDISESAPLARPETSGAAPQLMWLKIADLVVDESYQREIAEQGRRKVRKIAAEFDWDFFAPVIVSPVAGGRYAIVDGQHRTSGALLAGHESVPCTVILCDRRKQALAFDTINGNVTRVSLAQRFRALVAAGDEEALRLDALLARAGVRLRVSSGGKQRADALPGDTFAFAAIRAPVVKYGEPAVEMALHCILNSANGRSGYIGAVAIRAMSQVLFDRLEWLKSSRLLAAFRVFDIDTAARASEAEAHGRKGVVAADILRGKVTTFLTEFLERGRGVQAVAAPKPVVLPETAPAPIASPVVAKAAPAAVAPKPLPAPIAAPSSPEALRIDGHGFSAAEARLLEALLARASLTRKEILAATRDCPVALDAREESAADELVQGVRRKIGKLGVPILQRSNGYLIEIVSKQRLRGLLAKARSELVS